MNVLIIGNATDAERFNKRFPGHQLSLSPTDGLELIVWFDPVENLGPEGLKWSCPILCDSTWTSMESLFPTDPGVPVIGFISLPTFFERELFEISIARSEHTPQVSEIMKELGTEYEVVKDQVGLISPRIVGMIINEAYLTVEDGTASRDDIDTAMKLGTNYPKGPFEWSEEIGPENIHRFLSSLYEQTGEVRYKPSDLLLVK